MSWVLSWALSGHRSTLISMEPDVSADSASAAAARRQLAALLGDATLTLARVPTYDSEVYSVQRQFEDGARQAFFAKRYPSKKATTALAATLRLLRLRGVPVPEPVAPRAQLWRRGWLLLDEASGERLSDCRDAMSPAQLAHFYRSFGRTLGSMHSVTEADAAVAGLDLPPAAPWSARHMEWVRERLAVLDGTPEFGGIVDVVEAWFAEQHADEELFLAPVVPRLLHLDLNQSNVFVDRSAATVSAIIDWDECCFGHAEEELMRTECANFAFDGTAEDEQLRAAFFDGYVSVTPLDEGYESRRPLYYLSRLLVHAGCMIELEGYGIEADRRNALAEIEKVLAGAPLDYRGNALLSHPEEPEGLDGEATAAEPECAPEPPPRARRCLTYNVFGGGPHSDLRLPHLVAAVAAAHPDVLCLQEATPAIIAALKPKLPYVVTKLELLERDQPLSADEQGWGIRMISGVSAP